MKKLSDLDGRSRRRHRRFFRQVQSRNVVYVRTEPEFRMAERLHRVGQVTACVSKWNWGDGRRPFRELAVFLAENEAKKQYPNILPRKGSGST